MSGLSAALALLIADPVILGAQPAPITSSAEEQDVVQTEADAQARMTVPVAIEGTGPYRFLIDTGSQATVLSAALATRLGLEAGPTVRVVGIAGANRVATAKVDQIDFGKQSIFGLTVPLLDNAHMGADGIIGTDSLQHQRVLLDFERQTITIGTPRELGGNRGYEIVVKARRKLGRLILTNALIDGIPVDVVIDTGASSTIGNPALERAMRNAEQGQSIIESVTGHLINARLQFARELRIGKMGMANVVIAVADAPAFHELGLSKKPAIFLGMREMRLFKRVAIDFPKSKVLFDLPPSASSGHTASADPAHTRSGATPTP